MPLPAHRFHGTLLAALMACLVLVSAAFARQGNERNPDHPTLSASFAYSAVWPNRWTPMLVTLTGGAKAFEGELSVSYAQDEQLRTQIVRGVTATPGKTSTFPVLVNVPVQCSRLVVSVRPASGGRPIATAEFNSLPDLRRGEALLPPTIAANPLVVALGSVQDPLLASVRPIVDPNTVLGENRSAVGVAPPLLSFLDPALTPPTWAAFDGVLLVVTTGEAAAGADPRVRAAVREWVSAGGRLVILAGPAGEGWRDWLTDDPGQTLPLDVEAARELSVPTELAKTLFWVPPRSDTAVVENYNVPQKQRVVAPAEPGELLPAADRITARRMTLTSRGIERGWRLRYPVDDDASRGVCAEGPFGFGWVVVLGFNPERVPATVASDSTRRVWYDALSEAVGDWRARQFADAALKSGYMRDAFTSGGFSVSDSLARAARNGVLDRISNIPTVSHSVFPVLAVGIVVLAVLLGPVDYFVLRSLRSSHRSWATALLWIGVASLVAYVAPTLVRTGDTLVNRVCVLDASMLDAHDAGTPAWRTGITGVFAGGTLTQRFSGQTAGSWWRPTSAQQEFEWGSSGSVVPSRAVVARQTFADFGSLAPPGVDPWGGLVPGREGAGGNLPVPSVAKQWTFHTFQDQGRAVTSLRARVERTSDGAYHVEVSGVPGDATLADGALRTGGWRALELSADGAGRWVARTTSPARDEPVGPWAPPDDTNFYAWNTQHSKNNHLPFLLPGPDRRTHAFEHAIEHGHAVLYFTLTGGPADITIDAPGARTVQTTLCRFLVPVVSAGDAPAKDPDK